MDIEIKNLIRKAVENMLNKNSSAAKIKKIYKKHDAKVHFVPFQYRVFGGLLQSLSIQFGNFIEEMLHLIIENDPNVEVLREFSGKRNVKMHLSEQTDSLIDNYISKCQTSPHLDLPKEFNNLQQQIIETERTNTEKNITKHDIDVLFRSKKTGIIYYLEIKYNDDHDTGKFVDINRKFIKSYAVLTNVIDIKNVGDLVPIIYYFNQKKMKGNIYVDEAHHIYRGAKLFEEFFEIKYQEIDEYIKNIGTDAAIMELFDGLYQKIRHNQ